MITPQEFGGEEGDTSAAPDCSDRLTAARVRIAALNDAFRTSLSGGKVVLTSGIASLSDDDRNAVLTKVQTFDDFSEDNNPWEERDFGSLRHNGLRIFWKIDYYDPSITFGSEDPADPDKTTRVLTVMLAEEY
jgi:hypothetical protein